MERINKFLEAVVDANEIERLTSIGFDTSDATHELKVELPSPSYTDPMSGISVMQSVYRFKVIKTYTNGELLDMIPQEMNTNVGFATLDGKDVVTISVYSEGECLSNEVGYDFTHTVVNTIINLYKLAIVGKDI